MNTTIACNLILDCCGILILILLMIPAYANKSSGEKSNRRGKLLIYAVAVHYYVLFINMVGTLGILLSDADQVNAVCQVLSQILVAVSIALIAVSIFFDELYQSGNKAVFLQANYSFF